jgi:hypothetical protein
MSAHHRYGFALYGFWGAILLAGIIVNICKAASSLRASRYSTDLEKSSTPQYLPSKVWQLIKKHLILPTVFGSHRRRLYYGFSIPTRIEGFVIFLYWTCSLILTAVNVKTFEGNL